VTTAAAFDRGASRYDLLVGLNPGYHRELRVAAEALVDRVGHRPGLRLIDLACGTGASTKALHRAAPHGTEMLGLDASHGMLAEAEVFCLLAPGGWLVVQEYSVAGDAKARVIWDAVCRAVIIPLGVLLDRNHDLYHYLWRSVVDFDSVTQFADRLVAAGFEDVAHRTATGWQQGILHTFVARKPRENP